MSDPVTLYRPDGETVTVYTRSRAAALLASGEWYASEADAADRNQREEPTPAMAAKLDALEVEPGPAAVADETVTEAPAPAKPHAAKSAKRGG